ncbi:unnamed protein product, partial [Mesorhabditis belari]|uniref:G-protein coupled receptors family 1 profile domain-containing protein n=1 Tax=Mesorhabditis belari TaxID=2138241 RepID=A0AAF3E836_9BILA
MELLSICATEAQLQLWRSTLENFLYTAFFPPLFALGLVGNALNLMVLCSNDIMSRANVFLACLAVCDVCFLLLMVPHSLANFDLFGHSFVFRSLYLPAKMHLIAFANWTSAVAIWLVVVVCCERVLGVRSPLHRLGDPSRMRMLIGMLCLLVMAGALTFYNHVSHHCLVRTICNGTQILSICMDVNMHTWPGNRPNSSPLALRKYVQWTRMANAIFVVVVPLLLLIILNIMLLYYVRKRSYFAYETLGKVTQRIQRKESPSLPYLTTLFRRHSDQIVQQKTEHRVAVTVCAVVTSFTLTQAPSAVVLCINSLFPGLEFRSTETWYAITSITSFLVVVGKSLNFVVFCLSSSNFRHRLFAMLRSKCGAREERRPHSVLTSYTSCSSSTRRLSPKKESFQHL